MAEKKKVWDDEEEEGREEGEGMGKKKKGREEGEGMMKKKEGEKKESDGEGE